MSGVSAKAASEIVAIFGKLTQLFCHQGSLFLCKGTCSKFVFKHLNKFRKEYIPWKKK